MQVLLSRWTQSRLLVAVLELPRPAIIGVIVFTVGISRLLYDLAIQVTSRAKVDQLIIMQAQLMLLPITVLRLFAWLYVGFWLTPHLKHKGTLSTSWSTSTLLGTVCMQVCVRITTSRVIARVNIRGLSRVEALQASMFINVCSQLVSPVGYGRTSTRAQSPDKKINSSSSLTW